MGERLCIQCTRRGQGRVGRARKGVRLRHHMGDRVESLAVEVQDEVELYVILSWIEEIFGPIVNVTSNGDYGRTLYIFRSYTTAEVPTDDSTMKSEDAPTDCIIKIEPLARITSELKENVACLCEVTLVVCVCLGLILAAGRGYT